jgi:SAM-dependent methyltransferase
MWKYGILLAFVYGIFPYTGNIHPSTSFTIQAAASYGSIDQAHSTLLANCNPTTMYMNLGMIPETGFVSYADSAETLVRFVATVAKLSHADERVLDAGCGFGDQDMFLVREFDVQHIECIDVTPVFVSVATTRVRQAGLDHRIRITEGDVIHAMPDRPLLDVIISIDSALHFDSRRTFLRRAHDALREGGRLVLSDQVLRNTDARTEMLNFLETNESEFPSSNLVFLDEYLRDFHEIGFRMDVLMDVSNRTYATNATETMPPLARTLASVYGNDTLSRDFVWAKGYENLIFLVVVAVKVS